LEIFGPFFFILELSRFDNLQKYLTHGFVENWMANRFETEFGQ